MPYAVSPDGTRIAYQVRGQGAPLVLLAGQANNHHWWDGVREEFHATRSTVTLDWRGTGASDKPDVPYSTRQLAEDVRAVLDELGVERADVYGTSMGGRVAQWLAAEHGGRVRALVLGCTSPGGPQAVERSKEVRKALADEDPVASRAALLDLMYTPGWLAANTGPYQVVGDPAMPAYARGRHLVASNRHDAWDVLERIDCPTLVLHGSDDLLNPAANAHLLVERIAGARLELIPGARHAYFDEFRSVAGPLVREFIA
ncbi:alpha/beta hydrolase [Kitasatospora sp. MMS16-BH015]|uniref:alpha/beta fold hydrolase n=1 Tax=Kitasatospora sp. MMS16-BH015 TaxID=2018025 RepID=UPI000CA09069|nr:alpha/beta fold hydrolase [Kitasatospora sp. MMS16-BH015]AUG76599.1 alpha/beta hydrolase [Kitasatospora sp. MMS16-BH015]